MKRLLAMILSICILVVLVAGCGQSEQTPTAEATQEATQAITDWKADGTLKILAIGNSFSDDTMEYVYQIAKDLGVENMVLGILYIGGCTLDTHWSCANEQKPSYEYRRNTGSGWQTTKDTKMSTALMDENWDYVTIQQASPEAGDSASFTHLDELITFARERVPKTAQLYWNMTWAYQGDCENTQFGMYDYDQMKMYSAITQTAQSVIVPNDAFTALIPTGTAIQNVRTSFIGDTVNRDGYHLNYQIGRYTVGLALVRVVLDMPIDNVTFKPDGVSAEEQKVAIEAVNNAVQTPFDVTNSVYTEQPGA